MYKTLIITLFCYDTDYFMDLKDSVKIMSQRIYFIYLLIFWFQWKHENGAVLISAI